MSTVWLVHKNLLIKNKNMKKILIFGFTIVSFITTAQTAVIEDSSSYDEFNRWSVEFNVGAISYSCVIVYRKISNKSPPVFSKNLTKNL